MARNWHEETYPIAQKTKKGKWLISKLAMSPLAALAISLLSIGSLHAEVKRIAIDPGPTTWSLDGKSFGDVGTYRRIHGTAYGELDPVDPHNAIIQDIALAPRNARGMVEYATTFTLLIPEDRKRWSKVLLYEFVNRGASIQPNRYESGDAFLVSGWQGDIPFGGKSMYGSAGETIQVPVARNPDGNSITGQVLARFSNVAPGLDTVSLGKAIGYATSGTPPKPMTLDVSKALLTKRAYENMSGASSAAQPVKDWVWGDCSKRPFPGEPADDKICVKGGFNPLLLYELTYTAKDPLVLGVGFAASRDLIAFFKNEPQDSEGWKNPLYERDTLAVGRGKSQAGNALRTFINLGFNEAENGKRVLDGAMPVVAARQTPINFRFAVPGGASGVQEIGSDGVVWWSDWEDAVRHHPAAGLLTRCTASNTCPKVMELLGSTEFWALRASPDFVGTDNKQDVALPENVRRYYVASTQHGGGAGGFHYPPHYAAAAGSKPSVQDPIATMPCLLPGNPNPMAEVSKTLLLALKDWARDGKAPPPSEYPSLANGQLVASNAAAMGYPTTPALPSPDGVANPLLVYDLGPEFRYNDMSGVIAARPAPIVGVIPPLVPRVDADGNEVGGIHNVLQSAALGTYLGWNLTASGFSKGQLCGLEGSYIPFAKTQSERMAHGDTRLSLEERYGTQEGYTCVAKAAASSLVRHRFMLEEDAIRMVEQAEHSNVLAPKSSSSPANRAIADARCRQSAKNS